MMTEIFAQGDRCSSGYPMFRHRERSQRMLKARRWCWQKARPASHCHAIRERGTMFRDDSLPRER